MIFMALVGGFGTFEGAILGAVVFFAIETWFGDMGVWYLVGLGATGARFRAAFPARPVGLGRRQNVAAVAADRLPPATRCAENRHGREWRLRCCWARRSSSPEFPLASAPGSANWRSRSAADVIGVDVNPPARPLDAFIKADIGSAQGVAEIVETLPRRFDALCNVAGVSGMIGAAKTLAINFYGLRESIEAVAPRLREGGAVVNVASIAGYGWRANLERAKAFLAAPGFPDLGPLLAAHEVPDGEAYPLSKELLLL